MYTDFALRKLASTNPASDPETGKISRQLFAVSPAFRSGSKIVLDATETARGVVVTDAAHKFRAPFDHDFMRDPYPTYADLREEAAAQEVVTPSGLKVWLVTRYDDVRSLLADPRLHRDLTTIQALFERHSVAPGERREIGVELVKHMLNTDPPDHTRLRRLASKAFTSARVEALRPRIEEITDALLARVNPGQVVDIVDAFALPLPVTVICRSLGIPPEDDEGFQHWSNIAVSHNTPPAKLREAAAAVTAYLGRLIAAKRANPGDDLISALVAARDNDDELSETELTAMVFFLLVAGYETTARLIGNSIYALLTNPDQLSMLRADPALLQGAIEEFLRYEGPINISTVRYTTEPVQLSDVTIPRNEFVVVSTASANRDPARFDEPDRLDITRDVGGHVGFGHGIHFCLGARLGRMEVEIALRKLLERFQNWELAAEPGDMIWRFSTAIHGIEHLPVRLS